MRNTDKTDKTWHDENVTPDCSDIMLSVLPDCACVRKPKDAENAYYYNCLNCDLRKLEEKNVRTIMFEKENLENLKRLDKDDSQEDNLEQNNCLLDKKKTPTVGKEKENQETETEKVLEKLNSNSWLNRANSNLKPKLKIKIKNNTSERSSPGDDIFKSKGKTPKSTKLSKKEF